MPASTRIRRVLAPNPGYMTGTGTNTYVIDGGDGTAAAVDPGPTHPAHLDAIVAAAAQVGTLTTILVTHDHSDHLPAALPLAERTGATIYGHPLLPARVQPLNDGEILRLGQQAIQAIATPGHTDDSLSFWVDQERALFTGDLVAGAGTVIVDDSPDGLVKYLRSLEQLLDLGDCAIYPGHGPLVEDGPAKLREYIQHRRQREQQVIAVLTGSQPGGATVDHVVAVIYPDVASALVPMAARNVRAALWKLERERKVANRGGTWQLT